MMKIMNKTTKLGLAALLLAVLFASCVPQKKMLYLKEAQMLSETQSVNYVNERSIDYKLQPGDNLYIRFVNIVDERSAALLSGNIGSNTQAIGSESSIYLQSYTIDEEGFIELPLMGKIQVRNLTIDEAKAIMQTELDKYISQTTLIVKLSNFNLTILGEVNKPGMFKIYQQQINLFEAISLAGNMTDFAKNDKVKIIRQTDNGSEIVTVDMGSADLLSSPYYYLKPNDIVYVEPRKIKQWGFTAFPYATVFSIVSLLVTAYMLFRPTGPTGNGN